MEQVYFLNGLRKYFFLGLCMLGLFFVGDYALNKTKKVTTYVFTEISNVQKNLKMYEIHKNNGFNAISIKEENLAYNINSKY